ncbi:MAG: hypothetical protein AAGF75_11410 [Cyanobacteria bacterium P01_H01_bin.130]
MLIQTPDTDVAIFVGVVEGRPVRLIAGPSLTLTTGTPTGNIANSTGTAEGDLASTLAAEFVGKDWYSRPLFAAPSAPTQNVNNELEADAVFATISPTESVTIGFYGFLLESVGVNLDDFHSMGGPAAVTADSVLNTLVIAGADYTPLIGQKVPFVLSTDGGELPTGLDGNVTYGRVDDATTITPVDSATDVPINFTTDGSNLYLHPAQGHLMSPINVLDTPVAGPAGGAFPVSLGMVFNGTAREA